MIEIGYISDKGRCRELNEDALLVLPKEGIFVVADGVGGNNSGELASGETVKCVADYMRRNPISAQTDKRDIRRQMVKNNIENMVTYRFLNTNPPKIPKAVDEADDI